MEFRMNLFRGEGPPSKWQAITWQPPLTGTFHTPERFGLLRLVTGAEPRRGEKLPSGRH
jgi:hypothetical protein